MDKQPLSQNILIQPGHTPSPRKSAVSKTDLIWSSHGAQTCAASAQAAKGLSGTERPWGHTAWGMRRLWVCASQHSICIFLHTDLSLLQWQSQCAPSTQHGFCGLFMCWCSKEGEMWLVISVYWEERDSTQNMDRFGRTR